MRALASALMLCFGLAAAGRAPAAEPEASARFATPATRQSMTLRSTTDITVFGPVIEAFLTTHPDLGIDYEQWGSNDLFNISTRDCATGTPGADMVLSSGVHQMVQLVNDGCAQRYRSEPTAALPGELIWRDELWGVTREPAVMVYNRALVPSNEIPLSRFDLLDLLRPDESRYAGRVATYDIEASGLGFLFAFIDSQEATTFGGLLESLGRTRAVATCCSAEIIDGVANGKYLIAYNVLGSYALSRAAQDGRIGVIAPSDYTLFLSRAAMIPRGAAQFAGAAALLDFLLSEAGRDALRKALLIAQADHPDGDEIDTVRATDTTLRPIRLAPRLLVALDRQKREEFILRWRDTFPGAVPGLSDQDP